MEPEGPDTSAQEPLEEAQDALLPNFLRGDDAKRRAKTAVFAELPRSDVKPHRSMPKVSLVTRGTGPKRNPASHTMQFEQAPPAPPRAEPVDDGYGEGEGGLPEGYGEALDVDPEALLAAQVPSQVAPIDHAPPPATVVAPPPEPMVPQVQLPAPGSAEFAERVAAAVSAMRLTSERLAEQARSDALELALLVSRRILEAELSTNVERFFSVIRSVIRRAGESRRIVVRLHPDDAKRVEAAGGGRAVSTMAIVQVEISPDAELALGDCMVDADFGIVDGRLTTRLDEMRRLLQEAMAGDDT